MIRRVRGLAVVTVPGVVLIATPRRPLGDLRGFLSIARLTADRLAAQGIAHPPVDLSLRRFSVMTCFQRTRLADQLATLALAAGDDLLTARVLVEAARLAARGDRESRRDLRGAAVLFAWAGLLLACVDDASAWIYHRAAELLGGSRQIVEAVS